MKLGSAVLWAAVTAAVVVAGYLGFLGWHRQKVVDPVTGHESGPYQPWQVVAFGLVLAVLAFVAGWRGNLVTVVVVLPLALTACFALDAATSAGQDGLWVIGAALVGFGSLVGTAVVAGLGTAVR
jgi:hypothetical protein